MTTSKIKLLLSWSGHVKQEILIFNRFGEKGYLFFLKSASTWNFHTGINGIQWQKFLTLGVLAVLLGLDHLDSLIFICIFTGYYHSFQEILKGIYDQRKRLQSPLYN